MLKHSKFVNYKMDRERRSGSPAPAPDNSQSATEDCAITAVAHANLMYVAEENLAADADEATPEIITALDGFVPDSENCPEQSGQQSAPTHADAKIIDVTSAIQKPSQAELHLRKINERNKKALNTVQENHIKQIADRLQEAEYDGPPDELTRFLKAHIEAFKQGTPVVESRCAEHNNIQDETDGGPIHLSDSWNNDQLNCMQQNRSPGRMKESEQIAGETADVTALLTCTLHHGPKLIETSLNAQKLLPLNSDLEPIKLVEMKTVPGTVCARKTTVEVARERSVKPLPCLNDIFSEMKAQNKSCLHQW